MAARSALEIDITFEDGTGKPRQLSITVEDRKPHRIVKLWWARALASDIVVRSAAAGDSSALRELELRAPMILGPTMKLVYDRGADFLAFDRMMEDSACFVAERDGSVLGVACGARHTIRVGGQTHTVMLLHHARVAAEHRDLGLVSVLINHVFSAFDEPFECAYGYRAVDNADAERIRAPGRWDAGVCRAVIDCAAVAGPAHGRPATPADAAAVVDILDRAHAGEQMYFSPTPASFAARLERAPDLYTWHHLRLADGAVLGVWPAHLAVTIDDGTAVRTTRAVTLDHGFVDGAGVEFERLLRSACAELLRFGHDELTIMTSEGSPNYGLLRQLAHRMEPFHLHLQLPEPPGTTEHGVYVDAVYF